MVMALLGIALFGCGPSASEPDKPLADADTKAGQEVHPNGTMVPEGPVTGVRNGESFGPDAPDFTLTTMTGETFDLASHEGDVVVVNFWATWCAPCREEIPGFVALQEELGAKGVQFVGISLDEEGFEVVRPFAREMEINYPLVVDDGTVAARYGAGYALPTTFLINRKGQIVAHIPGLLPAEVLRPMLDELIREGAS